MRHLKIAFSFALFAWALFGQEAAALETIHKVYIGKMPNDLDQYLRA
jgi:hypothetical protein